MLLQSNLLDINIKSEIQETLRGNQKMEDRNDEKKKSKKNQQNIKVLKKKKKKKKRMKIKNYKKSIIKEK